MTRLLLIVISSCIFLSWNIDKAIADDDIFNITGFYKKSDASLRSSLQLKVGGKLVPVMVLRNSIRSRPLKMMVIFEDDVCFSVFDIAGGEGDGAANFDCKSGEIMSSTFTCRNTCYFRGSHSQKGLWTYVYRYKIDQKLPLEEILRFANITDTEASQTESNELSGPIETDAQHKSSKLDKAKSTCTELGFTLGTEKHGDCVLKMMDN